MGLTIHTGFVEMKYSVEFKPKAIKDMNNIPKTDRLRILQRIEALENNLQGDVKRLNRFTNEFRMRCGDWRVLFEIEESEIVIYRIRHRREVYR